jgi:DNA polymerase-4
LPFWGKKLLQPRLERAGLFTIGDVQRKSRAELAAAFGDNLGEHLFVLANGLDEREVVSERAAKSIGHEMTFVEDLTDRDDVCAVLLQLCEMVGRRLRRAEVKATVLRLKLRHPDFTTLQRQRTVAPTADDLAIYRVGCELLDACWPGRPGVRLLGISAASLTNRMVSMPVQGGLFDSPGAPPKKRDKLLEAMDAIRDRHGESAVRHGGKRRSTNPWGPE